MSFHTTFSGKQKDYEKYIKTPVYRQLYWITMLLLVFLFTSNSSAQVCCPDFKLKDAKEICPPEGACQGNSTPVGGHGSGLVACKLTPHLYTVYPNVPGFTYSWTITGGTPSFFTGNPVTVVWGSGSGGYIKVVISNFASGGSCIDSISRAICLIDGPQADFNTSNDTVCVNSPVFFTNTSLGGSDYLWDFGDGAWSNLANPPSHLYAAPGTYTVTLTATNSGGPSTQGDIKRPCGCSDTISKVIVVLSGSGPVIDLDCCFGTVCPGDTSSFCTPAVCGTYNWSVTGGTIIAGAGTNCIKVRWNITYSGPTTVSLAVPGCVSAPCQGITTIDVPVLYPGLPINGPTPLCVGASGSFFLPTLPGTYYTWTTTAAPGTFSFNDKDRNTPAVNITFSAAGTYQVNCVYTNPLSGCSGNSTFVVDVLPVYTIFGDDVVCEGSTTTYFGSGIATWSGTPGGATVPPGPAGSSSITWNIPGRYTITATPTPVGLFCNLNAVKVVEVRAKPVLGSITGPSMVCPGKNFTCSISSNTTGSEFVWAITGGSGSIMTQMGADKDSVIVKMNSPGPWTISVYQQIEISPGVFCPSLTQTLIINSFPAPVVSGPANVCVDAVTTFTSGGPTPPGGIQWSVSPPNRGSILFGQGTNSVSIRWHGTPTTASVIASNCAGSGFATVNIVNPPSIPAIGANGPFVYCFPNMPNNLMLSVPSGFTSYQWYLNNVPVSGATSSSYLIPNATFTGPGIYYFTVDVSNGFCSVTKTTYILIGNCNGGPPPNPVICSVDFTMNPNPACVDQPVTFTALPTGPGFDFQWSFGDGSTSFESPTQHTFVSAGSYNVTLTATIGSCVAVQTKTVIVNPSTPCIITASDTIFCPGSSVTLFGCPGMSSYQWYKDDAAISGATSLSYIANQHGEYDVEVTNGFGCPSRSNAIYIYMNALPKAKITSNGSVCATPGGVAQFQLDAFYNSAYAYDWSSNPAGATFSPNNNNNSFFTTVTLTLPGTLPYVSDFIVKVTDTLTGCVAWDTICVMFFETPVVNTSWYSGCEDTPVTLSPSPINPAQYNYQWSNGASTPSITVSAAGLYGLTVTDKANGCAATAYAAMIYPRPDLTLFPTGCDTIQCKTDTINMYIPLPLNATGPFSTYNTAYPSITWYSNGNWGSPIGTGQNFNFVANGAGSHQISVVVANIFGCTDTAGVFCLNVQCDSLDFGDAPDNTEFGFNYPTLLASNGARHVIVPGVYLGKLVDRESDGQPGIGANCDDNDCVYASLGDDEDGVLMPAVVMQGTVVNIMVVASVNGFLDTWFDYNVDGDWADAGEHVFTTLSIPAGTSTLNFTVPATATMGQSYVRYRFRTSQSPVNFTGLVNDGDVEDYAVFIEHGPPANELDFGDAPDNPQSGFNYPTLLVSNGARHVIVPGIRLGGLIDPEPNGQPSVGANCDDNDCLYASLGDDEDGVLFIGKMYVGKPVNVQVTASVAGFLNAWMDFNKDGDWADPGEQVFTNQTVVAGVNNLTFNLPMTALQGKTYMRFRFNTTGGIAYLGLVTDGEVEDYRVHACPYWWPVHTELKHYITIPHNLRNLTAGDVLGVFYQDANGTEICGGLSEFNGTDDQTMIAYGDNPETPEKDGFMVGEPIIWKLCSYVKGDAHTIEVLYNPDYPNHDGVFVVEGMSALSNTIGLHVIASATPGTICAGETVQLDAEVPEPTSGVTFTWTSIPAGFTSDQQNPLVTPDVNTVYHVEAFDGLFHAISATSVLVTTSNTLKDTIMLRNIVVANGANSCYNAIETITVAGNGETFTVQEGGNVQLVAGQRIRFLPGTRVMAGSGLHAYITGTGAYCCNVSPAAPLTKDGELSGNTLLQAVESMSFFKVYPNPTTGSFTLELSDKAESAIVSVEIYGVLGDRILQVELPDLNHHEFDLAGNRPGIYFIRVSNGVKTEMTKIIKQ